MKKNDKAAQIIQGKRTLAKLSLYPALTSEYLKLREYIHELENQ